MSSRDEPEARDALLFCVTEATPPEHIDALVDALAEVGESSGRSTQLEPAMEGAR